MKRSTTLRLVIMSTAPLVVSGCAEPSDQALVYQDVASCAKDGVVSESVCRYQYDQAWTEHLRAAPRYDSESLCELDFTAGCQQVSSGEYIPTMQGFMLQPQRSASRGSSFTVIPLYLGSGGFFRTGTYDRVSRGYKQGKVAVTNKAAVSNAVSNKVSSKPSKPSLKSKTMSRGGFGSRSAARGSWGG